VLVVFVVAVVIAQLDGTEDDPEDIPPLSEESTDGDPVPESLSLDDSSDGVLDTSDLAGICEN